MKLTDYVQAKMLSTHRGLFKGWVMMVWSLWVMLVKPEVFWVNDEAEPIEQDSGGGWVRRLIISLVQMVLGALRVVRSIFGITLLLCCVVLSPLTIVLLRLTARVIAKRNQRRRAKMLAEARADLTNRVPPQ